MKADHEYHALVVAEVVDETADCRSFVLDVPPALEDAFAYAAGQFCTFRATIDGETVVRCYSMSSSPDTGETLKTTVKRVPGGRMSNWMNDALRPGDTIEAMPPTGLFVLRDHSSPIVAFAGGSGITPVISIVKTALATTSREISLIYANRNAEAVIFAEELERLRTTNGGRLTIHHHLDTDRGGVLDAEACAAFVPDRAAADFYVCGPAPYMETVEAGLGLRGVAPDRVFIERFVTSEAAPPSETESAAESVVIRLDGAEHVVRYRSGDTILEAARRGGLRPPSSCEAGNCGTCIARLEVGAATMRMNNVLSDDELEEGWILTCQAIPTSREVAADYDA